MKEFKKVLITGADGYVGGKLAIRLLENSAAKLLLWVRYDSEEEYRQKTTALQSLYSEYEQRICIVGGNLRLDNPFETICDDDVDAIIHTAAVTRFNVEADLADTINRDGTRKVLEFASGCVDLKHYAQISTVYSTGLQSGENREEPVQQNMTFANHYERSKCEAEKILMEEYNHLPWTIYRIATIVADDENGNITQYNVFHNTMRLFYYGLTSLMPGIPETPIYLVTGDFVADAMFFIIQSEGNEKKIYHVCHEKEYSITIGELINLVFKEFESNESFRKRRILKPLFTDQKSFDSLADILDGMGGMMVRQALESIRPFSYQMFINKEVKNNELRKAYPHYQAPDTQAIITKVVNNLIATKWGRESAPV